MKTLVKIFFLAIVIVSAFLGVTDSQAQQISCRDSTANADAAARSYRAAVRVVRNTCDKGSSDCDLSVAVAQSTLNTLAMAHTTMITLCAGGTPPAAELLVINATATSATTVVITFSADIDSSSVVADGSQFLFSGGLMATGVALIDGAEITVTTMLQVPDAGYTVTVDSSVKDTLGNGVSTGSNSAAFLGWAGGT